MEGYVKGFVGASLVYFMAGALIGLYTAMGNAGTGMLFAHIHLNLLGFMTMMIFGVGYFILPRFSATTIRWPAVLPYHFWIANLGLILMISTYSFSGSGGLSDLLFYTGAASQVISVFLFSSNLLFTMFGRKILEDQQEIEATTSRELLTEEVKESAQEPVLIDPDMRVGEILETWPESVNILIEGGLAPLSDPEHVEHVKQMPVTLRMACMRHDADLEGIINRLSALESTDPSSRRAGGDGKIKDTALPDKSTIIKDVLKAFPETEVVFRKNYGEGCFSCPGQAFESIGQSALMHNVDPDRILDELHRVILGDKKDA